MKRYVMRSTPLILSTLLGATVLGCAGADAPLPGGQEEQNGDGGTPAVAAPATPTTPKPASSSPEYVPGELIIKFKSESNSAVVHDVASTIRERRSFAEITADRSASLDNVLARHGVTEAASLLRDRENLSTVRAKAQLRGRVTLPTRLRASSLSAGKPTHNLAPLEDLVNVYRLRLSQGANLDAAIAELSNDPHVEYVHPNYLAHLDYAPNDPYFSSSGSWGQPRADLWDIKKTRAPLAWDNARGAGVVVAVVAAGCNAVQTASVPFTHQGAVDRCYFFPNLGYSVNNHSMVSANLNGVNITNQWVGNWSYPARRDGGYYLYLKGSRSWSWAQALQ